jgi:hypothetical protein
VTLEEDRSQVRSGQAPQALACLNNVVVGLAAQVGEANLAAARRGFDYRFNRALQRYAVRRAPARPAARILPFLPMPQGAAAHAA